MVLTLTAAVTSLLDIAAMWLMASLTSHNFELHLKAQEEAMNGRLDLICQEVKGGGMTVGGVVFSGREAAMDWA
jgi:hypothetical protein